MAYDYETLTCHIDSHVLTATIHSPPVNVMGIQLYRDLAAFTAEVEADDAV